MFLKTYRSQIIYDKKLLVYSNFSTIFGYNYIEFVNSYNTYFDIHNTRFLYFSIHVFRKIKFIFYFSISVYKTSADMVIILTICQYLQLYND